MDDTQQSRVSDAAAAATRKRRSSILKSQRPARTPFSELEFNVATPTDTAKSRRVSFSRRTGVAEFVTNEATTTWKNFYEEHNKSLESSSNDSEANASRQPVGHLGKRIFDQQFEEVEAVDFISGLANGSLNNVNFSQQLASLECTEDGKLTAPQNKLELSAFTEQSKLFGNDFTAPSIGDNSGRIDVNFSAIQQVENDDLDEIEKDLGRASRNMGCHGPFSNGQNMSEYIEVDLNMTHDVKNDEDMSITDTVHSPVQDVSKNKKESLNDDWVADKENIAINPYAPSCETNFVVNEEPDQVLVFDGKRLTLQPDIPEKDKNYRQTLLPNSSAATPQRKTIVLNVNDDLPNFIEDNNMLNSKNENSGFSGFQEIKADEDEISETVPVHRVDIKSNRKSMHDCSGNISMTQALPTNIICHAAVISQDVNASKRRTIVFNDSTSNITMTETVPVKLLSSTAALPERRRTVLYEDDANNISITQAVPSNILNNENSETNKNHKTIVFDNDEDNILSMTQALSSNILDEEKNERKNLLFDDDVCNVSFTQALPVNIMLPDKQTQEKRRTIIYENDTANISVTQALPTNVILPDFERNPERQTTVVYENDTGNISVTQALPSNIILEKVQLDDNKKNNEAADNLTTQSLANNITVNDCETSRRRTIVFANDTGDISITQAIPVQLIPGYSEENPIDDLNTSRQSKTRNKNRTTIVYSNDEGDISMTEAISANIIEKSTNERKSAVCDEDEANISMALALSANGYLLDKPDSTADIKNAEEIEEVKEKVTDYDVYELDNLKTTEDAPQVKCQSTVFEANNSISEMSKPTDIPTVQRLLESEKRRTVIFDNDNCNISMTKPIPAEFITLETDMLNKMETKVDVTAQNQAAHLNVIVMQASTNNNNQQINVEKDYSSKVDQPIKMSNAEEVQTKSMVSTTDPDTDKIFEGDNDPIIQTADAEIKESLIMSSEVYYDSDTEDKSLMATLESKSSSGDNLIQVADNNSTELFYITKECEAVIQTNSNIDSDDTETVKPKDKEDELEEFHLLQRKLAELQTDVSISSGFSNQFVKRSSHISNKSNDTQNLLDLISNFTDNVDSDDDVKPLVIKVKDQGETTEHKRLSVAPNRQSIALSREDLLSNISMAQAALQKSRLALDDSDCADEDTRDASVDMSQTSDRKSYEVVKTLNFDDESITSETCFTDEDKYTPLKKTVFGETSYMRETKGKVIPTYLKDVSDGIKELMLDLVKPVSEHMPFRSGSRGTCELDDTSTHSTQVQAKITESSQIDLTSNAGVDLDEISSSASGPVDLPESKSKSRAIRNQVRFACLNDTANGMPEELHLHSHSIAAPIKPSPPSRVLVFDHVSPLNNILLAPTNLTDGHKYYPRQTDDVLCDIRSPLHNISTGNNYQVESVTSTQFTLMPGHSPKQEKIYVYVDGDQSAQNDVEYNSPSIPAISGRASVDQSVEAILKNLKDDEVNTLIAMRGNKELLQASSSLTLVDDLSEGEITKLKSNFKIKFSRSPQRETADMDNIAELSGISSRDSFDSPNSRVITSKAKKRIYSPTNRQTNKYQSVTKEVTPKPIPKMQKISRSPRSQKVPLNLSPTRNDCSLNQQSNNQNVHQSKSPEKKSPKNNNTKAGQTITVQQLITDYRNLENECKQYNSLKKYQKSDALTLNTNCDSIPALSLWDASFTSSKNWKSMKDDNTSSGDQSPPRHPQEHGIPSQIDWHPRLKATTSANIAETDSGVNIVAKIDMLPFMGSHECEWDSKSLADTWSFRLQHGRLRLTTRLAHRHDNATRSQVRGDTPVLDIAVETVQYDRKNPVATLCVRFAYETMRYIVSHALRTPCYAKDIPPLLRRCAAVARVALRWGRAMHEAKMRLALTLDNSGNVSLKVANVRLRSVWSVTMHLGLVVDDNGTVPWPKAEAVCVSAVVSDLDVPDEDVSHVLDNLPRDWGHAPLAIWRIFRYLKHRTQDDKFIL